VIRSNRSNRRWRGVVGPVVAALALSVGLAGCGAANEISSKAGSKQSGGNTSSSGGAGAGDAGAGRLSGTLNGAGSSAQEAAQGAWAAGFQSANPEVTVNYDPSGSGAGVEQFLAGAVSFAGSDAYLSRDQVAASTKPCGGQPAVEVPDYISPIALIYHLPGVPKLRLSPTTVAKIFAGTITSWNDPAITADNPGAHLPATPITAVHRSDDSGTTANLTDYLHQTAAAVWTHPAGETWPYQSGEGAEGTSGVVAAVTNGTGTIGYADASQAGDLGMAAIKVGTSWVGPTATAAAKAADTATPVPGRGTGDLALTLDRTTTRPGAYPLVLVSYLIACPTYQDTHTASLVKTYLHYIVSDTGQQAAAKTAGSAPLGTTLAGKATGGIETISAH
jgi:phosphate transport system substrate-binding protein